MKIIPILITAVIVVGLFFAFQESEIFDDSSEQLDDTFEITHTITIGTIHRDAAKMTDRFQPMADHIATLLSSDETKYVGKVAVPDSQENMIKLINNNQVDLYFDSPLIGLKINQDAEMSPILYAWKEGVLSYHSVFIVSKNSDIDSLYDIDGKTVIFEDAESTSGYFLPKYHLEQIGYVINTDSSGINYKFSLDDENTPIWVLEGKGDVGALSNIDFEDIPDHIKDKLKIIGKTQDVPRHIVFFRDGLDNAQKIEQIFLDMDQTADASILDSAKISKFSKLNPHEDLTYVRNILNNLNLP